MARKNGKRFVDLFAGLGGFHVALKRLGHECVFASEIDEDLQALYARNFGIKPHGDIRKIAPRDIPRHDILCAGSPCQPFSKAGEQEGLSCPKWGDLFDYVLDVLHYHKPMYVLLENVPNLTRHNEGRTWNRIVAGLRKEGYEIDFEFFSPHQFGVPQNRKRVFIVGKRENLQGFAWPKPRLGADLSIQKILDSKPADARPLTLQSKKCLAVWQQFIRQFPKREELPSFPIWSMEFGATYPYENETPYSIGTRQLRRYKGSHGRSLFGLSSDTIFDGLPSYARTQERRFPDWKIRFIQQNRALYQENKKWINEWLPQILGFPSSLQKFEWNCKGEKRNIRNYIIQFRASGVRVKRPTAAPSLVAMTSTQVPVIAWEERYMSTRECAKLQSLGSLNYLPDGSSRAFKALGNAVNARVVELIAKSLLRS